MLSKSSHHNYSPEQIKKLKEILEEFNDFLGYYKKDSSELHKINEELKGYYEFIKNNSDYIKSLEINFEEDEKRIETLIQNEFDLALPYMKYLSSVYSDMKNKINATKNYDQNAKFLEKLEIQGSVSESTLNDKIEEVKKVCDGSLEKFKKMSSEMIIEELIVGGFLKRIKTIEEYYEGADLKTSKNVTYQTI